MKVIVATKNKKKLKEIREILKLRGVTFKTFADFSKAPRIVENGKSFCENAAKKALVAARFYGEVALGEDSGLCVDVLSGAPGIYSSRFSGKNKSDRQNNLKVLRLLRNLPLKKRKAHYVCAVALADKEGLIGVAGGKCHGIIDFKEKGSRGFGYDPLFQIPKYKKTFGELGEGIKHKMSHRFRALKKAKKILQIYIEKQKYS